MTPSAVVRVPSPAEDSYAVFEERVVGDYRLVRRLGRGAAGDVWLGRHVTTGGLAAVKLFSSAQTPDYCPAKLLTREQRAVARLRHPHVVSLYDAGHDFLVSAYVHGSSLAHRLRSPLEPVHAVRIFLQVASALAHAHAQGVVHRDVKPSNILLDEAGNAYLTDFGVACVSSEETPSEQSGRMGTPAFWAPEQARGERTGPEADQYALARTMLWMLLGGQPPQDSAEALARLPSDLPEALAAMLLRATAADPRDRWPSVTAFAAAVVGVNLDGYTSTSPLSAPRRTPEPFGWCRGAHSVRALGPGIMRVDFRLSELVKAGRIPAEAAGAFLERTGYTDYGWAMLGRNDRLGALTDPMALARAAETFVLVHGYTCNRDMWSDVAAAICRDNGEAVVLVPDVLGFGESTFRTPGPRADQATPRALVGSVVEWLELLRIAGEMPLALVGHSIAGLALLTIPEAELPPDTFRVAITPTCPFAAPQQGWQLRLSGLAIRVLDLLPPLKHAVGWAFLRNTQDYAEPVRAILLQEFLRLPGRTHALLLGGMAGAQPTSPDELQRCVVVVGHNDKLVPRKLSERALEQLGFSASRIYGFASGGHGPHHEDARSPGWTGRNIDELVTILNSVLAPHRTPLPLEPEGRGAERGHSDAAVDRATAPTPVRPSHARPTTSG